MKPSGLLVLQRRVGIGGVVTFGLLILLNALLQYLESTAIGVSFYAPLVAMALLFGVTAIWKVPAIRTIQWAVLVAYGVFVQSFSEGLTGSLILGSGVLLASHYGYFRTARTAKMTVMVLLVVGSIIINSLASSTFDGAATVGTRIIQTAVYAIALLGVVYAYGLVVRESILITTERQAQLEYEVDLATRDLQQEVLSRKRAEEDATRAARRAEALAKERLALIQEIQHRAKNSLQMTLSLLDQVDASNVESTIGRVRAIGLVYDLVDSQKNISAIDLDDYLDQLASFLSMAYRDRPMGVTFEGRAQVQSDVDASTNTGLMLIELVEFAREYAFPESAGAVVIRAVNESDALVLGVSHAGAELPERVVPRADGTVEYPMLSAFFQRLGVHAKLEREGGSSWTLRIPLSILVPEGERVSVPERAAV